MVPFELSGGQHRADKILAEWGEDGRDAAREQLWIDHGFMLAYGTFLGLARSPDRQPDPGDVSERLIRSLPVML